MFWGVLSEENNYNYVVGARIKNTEKSTKENILKLDEYTELNDDLKFRDLEHEENKRLIISYSKKKGKKR